jgi:hypothetical protein
LHHGFCCVRVSSIGVLLLYGVLFSTAVCTPEDAIELHAFAPPLEALACVRPMAFLSGVHCLLPVGTVNCSGGLKCLATKVLTMNSAIPRCTDWKV